MLVLVEGDTPQEADIGVGKGWHMEQELECVCVHVEKCINQSQTGRHLDLSTLFSKR